MDKILYISLWTILLLFCSCSEEHKRNVATNEDSLHNSANIHDMSTSHLYEEFMLPDSLLTRDHICEYTFSDTVKAAQIIHTMRSRNLAPDYILDIAQGDLLFNNGRYYAALPYYEKALLSDSVKADNDTHMDMLHRMISCYDCLHDEKMKAGYVEQLLQEAKSCGNKAMQSVALFNLGKMSYYQESKERGYEMIAQAINLMEESDYKYKFDNLRYNYNSLFIMQQRDKRYKDALATLEKLEDVVEASTKQEPEIKDLNEKELKTLYANRAVTLLRLGRDREADEAYQIWKKCNITYTKDDYLIAPYLTDRKMYDEVIQIYSSREKFLRRNRDTINYHMMTIKRALGNSYVGIHDYQRAAAYFRELAIVTDSLKVREQQSSALELAEVYKTNEQAAQLKEQENTIRIRTLIFSFTALLLAVAVGFIVRILRDKRVIQRKNDAMVGTINELMTYKNELFIRQEENIRLRDELQQFHNAQRQSSADTEDTHEPDSTKENADFGQTLELSKSDRVLYDRLCHEIISRKLYLNPDFNKSELLKEIHVPANKFAALFKTFGGCSFSQYIQNCRIDHAVRLMREHPQWSMEAIAKEAQMSKAAFYKQFQKKYGMNPSSYIEKELFPTTNSNIL